YHTLDNGIRLIHYNIKGPVAHCGILVNAGSRDEKEDEHGIAHFIEHMLFKGTKRRKAYHILSRLEDVGGELNAYTTKEETAIHASFLKEDYERTLELISDILFRSGFPAKEIEKEKDVVIEEINSYLDSPSELIFDDFEELIFSDQPIGRNILGSPESVRKINRKKIKSFIEREYLTGEMVFCSIGEIPDNRILRLFQKYFSSPDKPSGGKKSYDKWTYQPVTVTRKKDTFQNHCIIGNVAYDIRDEKRVAMFLLNNILCGQGMNSRLNLSLREKNGLAYNVESNYNPYCDTGVFSIYFGTDSKLLEKSTAICLSELKKLRTVKLGPVQMSKARSQMKGYLARGYDNHENLMLSMAKSMMVFDQIETFESSCRQIDAISPEILLEIANEIFEPSRLSTLIYE
ncbi:MAG TPA: pitrilysin family protein, partial [Bacteroidales bacterium]|nr:pitrilysin family protein [Bacteroidales bacterium]